MRAIRQNPCKFYMLSMSDFILFVRAATGTCDSDGP